MPRTIRSLVAPCALLSILGCGADAPPPPQAPAAAASSSSPVIATAPAPLPRLHFRVAYDGGSDASAVEGRLLVAMTSLDDVKNPFDIGFDRMREQWLSAAIIGPLAKGASVGVDPDAFAWPRPFSKAPAGKYRIAVNLVRDGQPSLWGAVVEQTFDPAHAGTIDLHLANAEEHGKPPEDTDTVKVVDLESKLLSAFYGRPITMDALVTLPEGYGAAPAKKYATEYFIPGFGGGLRGYAHQAPAARQARIDAHYPAIVRVILPGMIPSGHHVFADSVNDGPWGRALVEELIPELEHRFALAATPGKRFLAGQSSGGWGALWLQITHPDFFGGEWSFAPDPVDFRSFTTVDITPGSKQNFFKNADGTPRMLMRDKGQDLYALEEFVRYEDVSGDVSALGTFDWVFSPRGPRGLPEPFFDRATGEQDPKMQQAWEKWDIHKVLDAGWKKLGPKLKGKLHVFAGSADSFHLNESVSLLCDFLKAKGSDAVCEIVPGKTHFDLQGDPKDAASLTWRVEREMAAAAGTR